MDWLSGVLAVFGLVGGGAGLAAVLRVRGERDKLAGEAAKIKAEAASIIEETAARMVTRYEARVDELERKVIAANRKISRLERQLRQWQEYATGLVDLIRRHGLESELPDPPGDPDEQEERR